MVALSSAVVDWARSEPDRRALVFRETTLSYRQLADRIRHTAGVLKDRGLGKGDVVALLMRNSAAFIELAMSISHIGAIALPVNYRLSADEVNYILGNSNASLLCVDHDLHDTAIDCPMLVVDEAALSDSTRLGAPSAPILASEALSSDDIFRLMYTSGTTDRPKGVVHTYNNYYWKCLDHINTLQLDKDSRLLVTGPLYHVGAFDLPGLAVFQAGGQIIVLREFDAKEVLAQVDHHGITGIWLAPVMLNRLLAFDNPQAYQRNSVRWVIGGGERTPVERIQAFTTLFPEGRYIDAYGLTETCSGDTMMMAGKEIEKIGSAGVALPNVRIEICDENGTPLEANQVGEICLTGPKIMKTYWQDPERTAASFFGDRFRSGDMGYLDEDGFLFLVDRKKDMVLTGGENVASSEVERVLYQMPGISEAAVIGLPDPTWGECVVAIVVLDEGHSLTLEELQSFFRGKIASFKTPKQLIVTDALPRNPSGKILKRVLRDELIDQ